MFWYVPQCGADVQLYHKWYCNQAWANASDAVLLPSSDSLTDVLRGDDPFDLFIDRFLGQCASLRDFLLGFFRWITGSVVFKTTVITQYVDLVEFLLYFFPLLSSL